MSSMFGERAQTVNYKELDKIIAPGSFYPKLARPGKLCNSQAEKS